MAAALVGALVATGVHLLLGTGRPPADRGLPSAPGDPSQQAESSDVTGDLQQLRRRLTQLESADRQRGQASAQELEVARETALRRERSRAQAAALADPAVEGKLFSSYFAALDQRRFQETADPAWNGRVGSLVGRGLKTSGLEALSVTSVECGSSLCRIELDSKSPDRRSEDVHALLRLLATELPQASVYVPVGASRMTAYLARNGTDLPDMEVPDDIIAGAP